MHHKLTCNAALLAQTLKDATVYTSKDVYSEATCHVLLTVKGKSLTIIACDGLGYYERRIPLVIDKGEKPSLPGKEQRLCLTCQEALALHRRIPTRLMGNATLELEEPKSTDRQTLATLTLPDGASTTFFAKTDVTLPDYNEHHQAGGEGQENRHRFVQRVHPRSRNAPRRKGFAHQGRQDGPPPHRQGRQGVHGPAGTQGRRHGHTHHLHALGTGESRITQPTQEKHHASRTI